MSDIEEFKDHIAALSPLDFENYLFELFKATGRYSSIEKYVVLNNRQIDILITDDEKLDNIPELSCIVEVKSFKRTIQISVVDAAFSKLVDIRSIRPNCQLLIISPSGFSKGAIRKAQDCGISLWGAEEIFELYHKKSVELEKSTPKVESAINEIDKKVESFMVALSGIKPGKENWARYQSLISDILEFLFTPPLDAPKIELADDDKRNRRDLIFENSSSDGFWRIARESYDGHYIVVDAKNYGSELKKRPILDMAHYLKPHGCGLFSIIVSRKGFGNSARHAAKEQWIGSKKMIVSLNDNDIREMLELKRIGNCPEDLVRGYISDFRMPL